MDIEEEPFETLDIVEVAINNDNIESRNMITNLEIRVILYYRRQNPHTNAKYNVNETNNDFNIGNVNIN